ncbi:hydrogenase nickel incorporation protein HypA/HybF [Saccharomonospora amisosensis]|uniref:Hydrogenase maturation factor HypA n=1 Tax=Saccharomonospora amisosensis TaxID=1128677 RepID=A0A7X5UT99_9PSEU|nr:hydrogenase maturation nickel metallochaperone HypA [Saccharomonospora amisosensis]NIJ13803.1 hydrogenase nickel incorporation protein HypA/HybF [Saccharomonospora amisosensis]
MHELSIAKSMVDAVLEQTAPDRVVAVHLELGKLSGVEVDAIDFCFDVVTRGTRLEGARLSIEQPAGQGRCRRCGAEFAVTSLLSECACGSLDIELSSGDQVRIRHVEVKRDVRDLRV